MKVELTNEQAELLQGFVKEEGGSVGDVARLLLDQSIALCAGKYQAGVTLAEAARMEEVVKRGEALVAKERELNENLRKQFVNYRCENMALRTMLNGGTIPVEALPQGLKQ